ncbi:MAG: hypothetical protein DRQ48_03635 [Gammaproteobacteria bacterium]|nr:MAG: hypothetical protein DRQ48_03635 [Gammaproteobacteria bacterium]
MFYYLEKLLNVKAMKSQVMPALLVSLCIVTFMFSQESAAESIARIKYPTISIKDDVGDELIHVQAVAELSNITINGSKASELSDLAWDNDEQILYALSDNGHLLSFKAVFNDNKFVELLMVNGISLHDGKNKKLRWKNSDSEGLALINSSNNIQGDTQFVVSFERLARVIQYNQQGFIEKQLEIPEKLKNNSNYRSKNKSLESILFHDQLGLIIGTEYSLKGKDKAQLGFYTLDGKFWSFPAYFHDGALTGLSSANDNDLLALERVYGGFFSGFKVALHHLRITEDHIETKVIALFLPEEGFFNDNFEGIERHKDDYYFMISDDNNHFIKRTLLIYFKYPR